MLRKRKVIVGIEVRMKREIAVSSIEWYWK